MSDRPPYRVVLAGLVLALLFLFALAIGLAWAPDRPLNDLKARWAPPPSRFVELQGIQVHLRDEGAPGRGPPIVLLHGTSASLHTWQGWADALTPHYRVIRVDLPGFGLTGPFPHDDYHVERYVEFVVELLDHLSIPEAVIGGNSLGGQIAWQTAVDAPERVAGLVLVNAAGFPLAPESVPVGFRIARIPWLQPLMTRLLPRGMIESSLRNVYGDPARVTDALVDRYYELALRPGNRRALGLRLEQAAAPESPTEHLGSIRQPTLILWGGRDRLIPPATALKYQRAIDQSRLVVFAELGHVPHEEDPVATVAVVMRFLEEEVVSPWRGRQGQAAFYRQMAQADSKYTDEVQVTIATQCLDPVGAGG